MGDTGKLRHRLVITVMAAAFGACSNAGGNVDGGTTNDDAGGGNDAPPVADAAPRPDAVDADTVCAGEVSTAELVPLDIYVMLDRSGSMSDKTGMMGQGAVKWEAVTTALSGFLADPRSQGIGVGLQYFPIKKPAAPASCTSSADCTASNSGPCVLGQCSDGSAFCGNGSDCPGGTSCNPLGQCANKPETLCLPIGASCPGNQGQCVQITSSTCLNTDSCETNLYAGPDVAIASLPGNAAALNTSMTSQTPAGGTPTAAALQGAIDHASTWATANPDHTVVVVLATDGEPTVCTPLDQSGIGAIAAAGAAADPSVLTFVIGIIENNNTGAQTFLNAIADAGGTQQAYFVDPTNQDVSDQFRVALDSIRGTALACEYQIPDPGPGQAVAFDEVNVEHTPVGSTTPETIGYVGSAGNCQAATGGWYYDIDPTMGTPTKIIVCPSTCGEFASGGTVDIRVGCQTIVL